MSSALQRLLDRTLPDESTTQTKKREKRSRSVRKSKTSRAAERSQLKALIDPKHQKTLKLLNKTRNVQALKTWDISADNSQDLEDEWDADVSGSGQQQQRQQLYESIIKKRFVCTTTKERQGSSANKGNKGNKGTNKLRTWPGLTPGLAPVGYETDDEED